MVLVEAHSEYFLVPVGIAPTVGVVPVGHFVNHFLGENRLIPIHLPTEVVVVREARTIQQFQLDSILAYGETAVVGNSGRLVVSAFRCNDHDRLRIESVDGRSRSVLEHGNALHFIGIDVINAAWYAIHDRLHPGSPDEKGGAVSAGNARGLIRDDSGNHAAHQIRKTLSRRFRKLFSVHLRNGARDACFFLRSVPNHNHIVKQCSVFLHNHRNGPLASDAHGFGFHAHKGELQHITCTCFDGKIPIMARKRHAIGSDDEHRSIRNRIALLVRYRSRDCILRKGLKNTQHRKER